MVKNNPQVNKIVKKIKKRYGVKTDAALERIFKLKKRTLNNWLRANNIPHKLRLICIKNGIDLDDSKINDNEIPCIAKTYTKYLGDPMFERIKTSYDIHKKMKGKDKIKVGILLDQWIKLVEDIERGRELKKKKN